jgi:hypothetical protein
MDKENVESSSSPEADSTSFDSGDSSAKFTTIEAQPREEVTRYPGAQTHEEAEPEGVAPA